MKTEPTKDLEIQRLDLEWERLKLERQGTIFRYVAILGGIATFAWTSFSYFDTAHRERDKQSDERARAIAVQRVASMQPFLERQLRFSRRLPRQSRSLQRLRILQTERND